MKETELRNLIKLTRGGINVICWWWVRITNYFRKPTNDGKYVVWRCHYLYGAIQLNLVSSKYNY